MKPYEVMLQVFAKKDDPFSGGRTYYSHPSLRRDDMPKIPHQSSATGMQAIPTTGVAMGIRYMEKTGIAPDYKGENPVVVCSLGDASCTEGELSEAFQMAALKQFPILAHSDADALMHAICDAILGALGEEDIGHFFPNTDPHWKNVPSKIFLEEAARQVLQRNGRIVNVDSTVIAQEPKVYPHIAAMKKCIADALGLREIQIGIKATTNEMMGFIGREEGIAAMAVVSLDLP